MTSVSTNARIAAPLSCIQFMHRIFDFGSKRASERITVRYSDVIITLILYEQKLLHYLLMTIDHDYTTFVQLMRFCE